LKHLPVAYLLEGTFNSAYAARFAPAGATEKNIIKKGQPAKILICSDGDLPRNEIDPKTKKPLPLGFDKNAQQTFGHKDFILNALEYMIDEEGIISSRSKEVRLRPLDKALAQEERGYWQTFNLLLPLLGVALFGIGRYFWRKKKYES
jgi:gliding-associated putative ABC transporter substrate-binding component GldG